MNAITHLKSIMRRSKLPMPEIPANLRDQVIEQRPWVWGTRPDDPRLYDLSNNVSAALSGPDESFLFGHDGYGTNSWFIHCYLNHGILSAFIQVPWGGAHTNATQAATKLKHHYDTLAQLMRVAEEAALSGKALPGRLVIQQSEIEPSRWAWVSTEKPVSWNEEDADALTAALHALRA